MQPDLETPSALAAAAEAVEDQPLPVGTAENGPDWSF